MSPRTIALSTACWRHTLAYLVQLFLRLLPPCSVRCNAGVARARAPESKLSFLNASAERPATNPTITILTSNPRFLNPQLRVRASSAVGSRRFLFGVRPPAPWSPNPGPGSLVLGTGGGWCASRSERVWPVAAGLKRTLKGTCPTSPQSLSVLFLHQEKAFKNFPSWSSFLICMPSVLSSSRTT